MALARLRNAADAQELTQDVFVHVFQKLRQLRQAGAFPGWLRRITVRMAINRIARTGRARPDESALVSSVPANTATPLDNVINRESADRIHEGLDRLSPMDRDTLMAFYF